VRTLSGDCQIRRLTPSENTPFHLDNCTLGDGDDITTTLMAPGQSPRNAATADTVSRSEKNASTATIGGMA